MDLKHGVIRVYGFNGHLYGFITYCVDGREIDIFFHLNAYRNFDTLGGLITWTFGADRPRHLPKSGDEVVFEIGEDNQGRSCAFPWAYLEDWNKVQKDLAKPVVQTPIYRYRRRIKKISDQTWGKIKELWEGTDPNSRKLLDNYWDPRDTRRFYYYEEMVEELWFEISKNYGQTWTECPPPVHLLRPQGNIVTR